jgi:hypothetical protein
MQHGSELCRLLADLDKTADDVASIIRADGIHGVRNTVRFLNPIVRYAQRLLRVDDYTLDVMQPGIIRMTLPDGATAEAHLPQGAQDFLEAFHRGQYPDLEMAVDAFP